MRETDIPNPRSLADEVVEPEVDQEAIAVELQRLGKLHALFSEPGWEVLREQWESDRVLTYQLLGSEGLDSMESVSIQRGRLRVIEQVLTLPAQVAREMRRLTEPEQEATDA